ncbi:hypothetical protein [[Eubacterium] cellulosolvens]
MSWSSWISKFVEKKVMDQVGKQLNLEVKNGTIDFKSTKKCKFCQTDMPLADVFCPICSRSQK